MYSNPSAAVRYAEIFAEKLELLGLLAAGDLVSWSGRFRPPLDAVTIVPRIGRTLPVRVGVGGSVDSARRAGTMGLPMTLAHLGGSPGRVEPVVDAYWAAVDLAGHPRAGLGVGLASHLYVGATSQAARDIFYPHYRTYAAAGRGIDLDRSTFELMAGPNGALLVGSAQEIVDKIGEQHRLLAARRFIGLVDIGGLPRAEVLRSIQRFAVDVGAAVRGVSVS